MSQAFSPYNDPSSLRLTPEETRELVARLESRRQMPTDGSVSVQEVAQALGMPVAQVQDMVWQMRSRQAAVNAPPRPISSSQWLKRNLWIWMVAAIAAVFIAMQGYIWWINRSIHPPPMTDPAFGFNFNDSDFEEFNNSGQHFPYADGSESTGEALKLHAPDGFSYYVSSATQEAAIMGDDEGYKPVAKLSAEGVATVQNKLADDLVKAFDKLVAKDPIEGRFTTGEMELNYYPGGDPVGIEIPLPKEAFPYSPNKPEGKKFRNDVLSLVKKHWEQFTTERP